jgi:class 3 adenylate cyclase
VAGALEELADLEEVGTLTLKGFLKPVPVFNALGLRRPAS